MAGTLTRQDKPVGEGSVVLVPAENRRDQWHLYRTVLTNAEGKYTLRAIPPGEYTAFAFAPGEDPTIVQDPEILRQMASRGCTIKLDPGANQTIELNLYE